MGSGQAPVLAGAPALAGTSSGGAETGQASGLGGGELGKDASFGKDSSR